MSIPSMSSARAREIENEAATVNASARTNPVVFMTSLPPAPAILKRPSAVAGWHKDATLRRETRVLTDIRVGTLLVDRIARGKESNEFQRRALAFYRLHLRRHPAPSVYQRPRRRMA